MPYKLTSSFTVLSQWYQGRKDDAIKTYFHLPQHETPQMRMGKEFHEAWSKEILETKMLPSVFGRISLANPMPDKFMQMDLTDDIELIGYADLIDGTNLYEFKTGISPSNNYVGTYQGSIYGILARANGIPVKLCHICHYNQYRQKSDTSIFHISDNTLKEGREWAENVAWDMYSEWVRDGVFDEFQHYRDIHKQKRAQLKGVTK